jgi:hypothetical protein
MDNEPSIQFGPLKIWILQRQFPEMHDYWDGNWLSAIATCEGHGSRVKISGSFLHLGELEEWRKDLEAFSKTLKGSVELPTIEPELKVKIGEAKNDHYSHQNCEVEITGDHMTETHRFLFTTDQTYFPELLVQLSAILRQYPIRVEKGILKT